MRIRWLATCAAMVASARAQTGSVSVDFARVAEEHRRATELHPRDATAWQGWGVAEAMRGRHADAIAPLERALALNPSLWGAAMHLGIAYYRTNRFEEARKVLAKAKRLRPAEPVIRYWLGAANLALRRHPEAIGELRGHSDPEAIFLLARAYAEYSAELTERVLRKAPESAEAARVRAEDAFDESERPHEEVAKPAPSCRLPKCLVEREEYEAAFAALKPVDAESIFLLAKASQGLSRAVAEKVLAINPDSARAHLMRGEAYERGRERDFERALSEYRRALELQPSLAGVQFALGRTLWKLRRHEEASQALQAELRINPNHGAAHYYLGRVLHELSEHARADTHLRQALAARPGWVDALRALGQSLSAQGLRKEAVEVYRDAVAADPTDAGLHALLAAAYRAAGDVEQAARSAQRSRELSAARNRQAR